MYYCHTCDDQVTPTSDEIVCPNCHGGFIEEISDRTEEFQGGSLLSGSPNDIEFLHQFLFPNPQISVQLNPSQNTVNSSETPSTGAGSMPGLFPFLQLQPNRTNGNPWQQSGPSHVHLNFQRPRGQGSSNLTQIQQDLQTAFQGFENSIFQLPMGMPNWNFMEIHGNSGDYAWGPNGLDNIISQLLGQLENSGPPPASKQSINSLPVHTIQHDEVDKECSVCMDNFKLEDKAKSLPCNHIFHVTCIDPWLNLHNTCPVCRELVEESCSSAETNNSLFNHSFPPNRNNDDDHTYST